uniref:Uncharacterized protein n=1 Tax=Vespula pensylvanica TaxID=30213 RepID=A0A834N687_VESPE|nr:hypothetical protein H0235_016333 [Vespula pensylvanica]
MPCFSSNTWIKYHAIVSDTAYRLRSEAAKEKTRIARLKGNSITTVFLVSPSSQLYHGLKSSIKIVASRDQQCFTSFYDLTTEMESNAIVDEFRCSLEMHDLKYTKLIGGGESTENSEDSHLQALCLNKNYDTVISGIFCAMWRNCKRIFATDCIMFSAITKNVADYCNGEAKPAETKQVQEMQTTGGKRINFVLCSSYQTRCEGAIISMNSNGSLHHKINYKLLSKDTGNFTICE